MLDLHIWGPAFGLPSIDPECIAAVAYFHSAASSPADWRLIPSNDPSLTPANLLPALNHDGVWTSGYANIIRYLNTNSLVQNLDNPILSSPASTADARAISAYLSAHASPLLDLSLYVSSANWVATTRPAYSTLLPFPLTWTVPTLIRAAALKRTEHMGLGELDADFDANGGSALGSEKLPETVRRHLPKVKGKKTVGEEMTPEEKAAIRLFALVDDCLSGLLKLMPGGDSPDSGFFEGLDVSSLDCLAFGYLVLMREAPVPRTFLKDWLVQKTPKLSGFVDRMQKMCLETPGDLPWAAPPPSGFAHFTSRILDSSVRHIPSIGDMYAFEVRRRAERRSMGLAGTLDIRTWGIAIGVLATGLTAGYGVHMYRTLSPFGARTQVWRKAVGGLGRFGEAGALLGLAVPMAAASGGSGGLSGGRGEFADMDTDVLVGAVEQQRA
ncbi:outer mitochondrial membrane transport complex protein [Sarocladium implicatum]|nr:outer mitochondrial membrane transport complex protein [Sarocladium implicatum]